MRDATERYGMDTEDRATGVMLGVGCGDALGRPVEGLSAPTIESQYGTLEEMVGGGVHHQPPGTLTDDTDLALCLARSLVDTGGFAPTDVAERFVTWYEAGPIGMGRMTADAVCNLEEGLAWDEAGRRVWRCRPEGENAGNGSVMRCAPYAVAFADDLARLEAVSRDSSAITHADPRCTAGCAVLNATIATVLREDADGLDALRTARSQVDDVPDELASVLDSVPRPRERCRTTAYVIDTLGTALSIGLTADSAEDGIVDAVNLGGDTDTIGAVTGAVVGARFGAASLPERWLSVLDRADELRALGEELAELQPPSASG
jgi:ADP-ribosyl-[dinitrogen reductase] hydrolase